MIKLKEIFSILVIVFAVLRLVGIAESDTVRQLAFMFLGLTYLINTKEYYDKGDRKWYFRVCEIFSVN